MRVLNEIEIIMGIKKEMKMRLLPWVLILGGFCTLNMLPAVLCGSCMVVGITMLLERIWPEQWGKEEVE